MTDTRTALFLFEAGPTVGLGHALRCLALADALANSGWNCTFAVNSGFGLFSPMSFFEFHEVVEAQSSAFWTVEALKSRWSGGVELAVIDHYDLAADFEEELGSWAQRRLIIDDLLDRPHTGDALLCIAPPRKAPPQNIACETLLFGPDYALIRSEFAQERSRKLLSPILERNRLDVLVNLGGGVQTKLLQLCLEALGQTGRPLDVRVIGDLGGTYAEGACDHFSHMSVTALSVTTEMANLMARADLVIGACGHSSWERAAVVTSAVALVVASNQVHVADALELAKAAIVIRDSDRLTAEILVRPITRLLEDAEARAEMASNAAVLCDGYGAQRTALTLDPERDKKGRPVTFRTTTFEDGPMLYDWQSHPDTRRYSDNSRIPERIEHEQWLAERLHCSKTLLETVLCEGTSVASLRLDLQVFDGEPSRVVTIYTAPEAKRRGIASATLRAARRLVPEQPFYAKVNSQNLASKNLFAKAGYRQVNDNWFVSHPMTTGTGKLDVLGAERIL